MSGEYATAIVDAPESVLGKKFAAQKIGPYITPVITLEGSNNPSLKS
jgi:hypothetical protein